MDRLQVKDVVQEYQTVHGLTLRGFATVLTESVKVELTHVAIALWKSGKTEPGTDMLLVCLIAYEDWRRQFAWDMLRAKLPEVFGDGELFRAIGTLTEERHG